MRKTPFLIPILLSLGVLILIGCNPVKEEPVVATETSKSNPTESPTKDVSPEPTEEVSSPALAACNATEKTPGGEFSMCSPVDCDNLNATFPTSYKLKEPVASCSTEAVVGICTVDGLDKIYYTGDPDSLKSGCGFSSGEWRTP